jgi:protein tyrosine/serine phosphatase
MSQKQGTSDRPRRRWVRWVVPAAVLAIGLAVAGVWYVRDYRRNFACVVEGRVYRSGQPGVRHLEAWTKKYGLKTIVSLRGRVEGQNYRQVCRAADRLGLTRVPLHLSSNSAPTRRDLRRLIETIETAAQPMLLHCHAGIERTGLASVLAAMAVGAKDYDQAKEELFGQLQYLGGRKDDSVGALFAAYEDYCRANNSPDKGAWKHFRAWAMETYYPYYYHVAIDGPRELRLAPGQIATVELTVTNLSNRLLPFADPARKFNVAAFLGTSQDDQPQAELGPRLPIPRKDLLPEESIRIVCQLTAPSAGAYDVGFDLVEENRTWFARQGSAIPRCRLIVAAAATRPAANPAGPRI